MKMNFVQMAKHDHGKFETIFHLKTVFVFLAYAFHRPTKSRESFVRLIENSSSKN